MFATVFNLDADVAYGDGKDIKTNDEEMDDAAYYEQEVGEV